MIGTVAVAALAIAGAGCGKKNDAPAAAKTPAAAKAPAADPNEVLVTVNGAKLTRGEIDAIVDKQVAAQNVPEAQMAQARKYFSTQIAQAFIMKTLVLEAAKKAGMGTVPPDRRKARQDEILKANAGAPNAPKTFDEFIAKHPLGADFVRKEFEDGLVIQEFIEKTITSKIKVDQKKVEETLKRLADEKLAADKKAMDAEAKIKTLAKQLAGLKGDELKKKFGELAKANSDCPSKEKDGDLGEFTRGRMVKEFEDVAFKQEVGTVSAPVKTQFGWHLILPTKKTAAVEAKGDTPASPEKVQASHILISSNAGRPVPTKEQIEQNMKRQEEGMAVRKFFDELRANAKISTPGFPELQPEAKPAAKPAAPAPKSAPAAKPAAPAPKPAPAAKPATKPGTISSKPVEAPAPKK